jgi:hypothetical protein
VDHAVLTPDNANRPHLSRCATCNSLRFPDHEPSQPRDRARPRYPPHFLLA